MPANVEPLRYGANPDALPANPVEGVKEVLIGDGEKIIGSIPDIGPLESQTLIDTTYFEEAIALSETEGPVGGDEKEVSFEASTFNPSSVYKNLLEKYGEHFLEWEPETLRVVIADDFDLSDIPDSVWESILAMRVAGVGVTWEDYWAFEKASLAVAGLPVYPGQVQDVSVEDMAELYKVMVEINPEGVLNDEVSRYIAARMFSDGYLYAGAVFPPEVQNHLFSLGAPKDLTDSVHSKIKSILTETKDGVKSLGVVIQELSTSALDIQIGRYLSLL